MFEENFLKLTRVINKSDGPKLEIYRSQLREAYQNSYAPSWAAVIFTDNFGFFLPWDWGKGAIFGQHSTDYNQKSYKSYLMASASRPSKEEEWSERDFDLEVGS